MTAVQAIDLIMGAKTPAEIFGKGVGYRRLARLVHPDTVDKKLKPRGETAFKKLTEMYAIFTGKQPPSSAQKIGAWAVGDPLAKGDIADLYRAESDKHEPAVFKISRSPKDNDLMDTEAAALKALHRHGPPNDNFLRYIPQLYDSLKASDRRANIVSAALGYHSLSDIFSQYIEGLDFRHVVWMMNRLLSALGYAHKHGLVHGAVTPDHLLYHGVTHGLVLVDWCYSVEIGNPIKAIVKNRKSFYPVEVLKKLPSSPATDIYMAARSMMFAADQIPGEFLGILEWCTAESPKTRPQDAWELQDLWVKVAEKVYGKPKYVRLEIGAVN